MHSKKNHLPNLDGLRFIAAFLVIICHFHEHRAVFGLSNLTSHEIILGFGKTGVNIFFVLSGFLITTLLLIEKKRSQTISLKRFYIRRILRIWPLYYFIILICFLVVPFVSVLFEASNSNIFEKHYYLNLSLFLLILPSFAMHLFGHIPLATMTWSIGVEEIFYLVTPILIKNSKYILGVFVVFSIVFLFLGNGYILNYSNNKFIGLLILFLADLRLTCLSIGSIAAILYFKYPIPTSKWVLNLTVQIIFYVLVLLSIIKVITIETFNNELFCFFMAPIILNLAFNKRSILKLSNPIFEYLGRISYGIYMFHLFPIIFFCNVWPDANFYLIFCIDLILTIGLAGLSFKYFEGYFLKLKNKFS